MRLLRRPSPAAVLTLVVGLAVTLGLALATLGVYHRNERGLLNLRVRELGLVLAEGAPTIETPLASGAELVSATNGSPARFRQFFSGYLAPAGVFTSVSLWPLGSTHPKPTALVGAPPAIASLPERTKAAFGSHTTTMALNVIDMLNTQHPALGFA
jgi:hypothetical protein